MNGRINRGLFVSFEGPDGSGKSTVAKMVSDTLLSKGYNTIHTREPGGSELGEKLRKVIIENDMDPITETLLFHAGRRDHYFKMILPHVESGGIVVCERFIDSSYVYQGMAKKIYPEVMILDKLIGSLRPDRTYLIDVSVETSKKRVGLRDHQDRFETAVLEHLTCIRDGYLDMAKKESSRILVVSNEDNLQNTVDTCVNDIINQLSNNEE